VDPRAGLEGCSKSRPHRDSTTTTMMMMMMMIIIIIIIIIIMTKHCSITETSLQISL